MRTTGGTAIVEFAAVLMLGLPLLLVLGYAALETWQFFTIRSTIDNACRTAARALAINYGQTKSTATNPDAYTPSVFVPGFINPNSHQWIVVFSTAPNQGGLPYVSVTLRYPNGGDPLHGLAPFPNPDIFGIGKNFDLTASCTAPLE